MRSASVIIATQSRQEGECRVWIGALDEQGAPVMGSARSRTRVRDYIWERLTGTCVPERYITKAECEDGLCVAASHVIALPMREQLPPMPEKRMGRKRNDTPLNAMSAELAKRVMEVQHDIKRCASHFGMRNRADQEDVVQEVALRVCRAWRADAEILNVKAFALTITRTITIDMRRDKEKGINKVTVPLDDVVPDKDESLVSDSLYFSDPSALIESLENDALLTAKYREQVKKMPDKMRKVYQLRAAGLSQDEIACALGRSVNTVEQHLMRAYRFIRLLRL